jgi:SAM-dependent methyltransferase
MKVFLNKNGYTVYRCVACGLGKTDLKRPYELFVTEYYTKGYYTGNQKCSAFIHYKNDKGFIVRNMRQFLRKIMRYKSKGTLLDAGCALGFFVELALKAGFNAYGFDPSSYAVGEAKKLVDERRIKTGTIGRVEYQDKSFDVITLFDVFEHLCDPGKDIEKLARFLKDDGIIVIATGDTESVMAKVLKRRWTFYIPPQHLFFFNKTTLTALLKKHNLVPIEWFRIGKWLSLGYVLHLARTTGESNFAHSLYRWMKRCHREQTPVYLPVRDNMVTIVKKVIKD